jgi:hypothetical protein
MFVTLKELQLATLNDLLPLFTLCGADVSEFIIVLSDSMCERI